MHQQFLLSSRGTRDYAAAYFLSGRKPWASAGLLKCQEMAEARHSHRIIYHLLDSCQLLKHPLSLATGLGDRFSLYYLYSESCGDSPIDSD